MRMMAKVGVSAGGSDGLAGTVDDGAYVTRKTSFSSHLTSMAASAAGDKAGGAVIVFLGSPSGVYCVRMPAALPATICLPLTDQHAVRSESETIVRLRGNRPHPKYIVRRRTRRQPWRPG